MPGRYLTKAYLDKRNEDNDRPYRTSVTGGRRACFGGKHDPYPGDFNVKNCNGNRMNFRFTKSDGSNPPPVDPFPLMFKYEDLRINSISPGEDMSGTYSGSTGRYSLMDDTGDLGIVIGDNGLIEATNTDTVDARKTILGSNTEGFILASPSEVESIDEINWDLVTEGDIIDITVENENTVTFAVISIEYLEESITPIEIAFIKAYHVSGDSVTISSSEITPVTFEVTQGVPSYFEFMYSDLTLQTVTPGFNLSETYSGSVGRYSFSTGDPVSIGLNSEGQIVSTDTVTRDYTSSACNSTTKSVIVASPSEVSPIDDINWDIVEVGNIVEYVNDNATGNPPSFEVTSIEYLQESETPLEIAVVGLSLTGGGAYPSLPGGNDNPATFIIKQA